MTIEKAPAVHRGSRCPDLVIMLTALREVIHDTWYRAFLELVARVRSDGDEASARVVLSEARMNPKLYARAMPEDGGVAARRAAKAKAKARAQRAQRRRGLQ